MKERQRHLLSSKRTHNFPGSLTPRSARNLGLAAAGLVKLSGTKIKGSAQRLLPGSLGQQAEVNKANRASAADADGFPGFTGSNGGWARAEYGEYYATSVPVYAAIRLRAEALSRAPAVVYRTTASGNRVRVEKDHPAQRILERVNRWYTSSDLWRATEIYLNLWGSAFWAIEKMKTDSRRFGPCDQTA
ncbi:MAG: phage portal protein [Dehalococcoidia bacterium]|nr:phage portal protein [Dehalococcoidia bacterium]